MSFCLVFFFSRGDVEGLSGICTWFYIHGHAWLSDWDVSGGLGAGSAPGSSFGGSLPCPGPGLGSPLLWQGRQPLPGHCPHVERILEGDLSPRPTPSPSPCPQSGVVGEVANRFPGQHRGRLRWSSGHRGGARSHPAPPTPFPGLATQPPLHPLVLWLSWPLLVPGPEARQPWQWPRPLRSEARVRLRLSWAPGWKGSLRPSPMWGEPL